MTDSSSNTEANPDSLSSIAADSPTIVSISDIHGYLAEARSALSLVNEAYEQPLVKQDDAGRLHWAGEDEYVLVVIGDAIDRGPSNTETLEAISRLRDEAPPGHVVFVLGNHEANALFPDVYHWPEWYSGNPPRDVHEQLFTDLATGRISAAFSAYGRTYVHAGSNDPYSVAAMNERLREAGQTLREGYGDADWNTVQRAAYDHAKAIVSMGTNGVRGAGSGLVWMDWRHLASDAPPQVVGHTRVSFPTRRGSVVNANTLRKTQGSTGGESVTVGTPDTFEALVRDTDGGVSPFNLRSE